MDILNNKISHIFFILGCSRSNLDYIFFVSLAIITGWLLSGGMVALIATILDSTDYTMSWYKNSWIVIGLYCMPIVFCLSTPIALLNHFNKVFFRSLYFKFIIWCNFRTSFAKAFNAKFKCIAQELFGLLFY